jgi:hypothetical protein
MQGVLGVLLAAVVAACSAGDTCVSVTGACGGDDVVAALCLGPSLGHVITTQTEIVALLDSLGGAPPANATFDPLTGAYSIALQGGTIVGVISSPHDISDGLDETEEATATWSLDGAIVNGTGSLTIRRSPTTEFEVTGSGSTSDDAGCELDVTSIDLTGVSPADYGAGTMAFSSRSSGGTVTGTVTFDGSGSAEIAARFAGETVEWTLYLSNFSIIFGSQ